MGGGHKFPYPKWVWTPSGGWWPTPKNQMRNGLIYTAACGVICYYAVLYCEPRTVRINLRISQNKFLNWH